MKRKAVNYLIAFSVILVLNFLLPRLMPGDPLTAIYGDEALLNMSPQMKAVLVKRFQSDQPLHIQFYAYMKRLCRGDLGESYYHGLPVMVVLSTYIPWTLFLVGSALLISCSVGFVMGLEAAWKRGKKTDRFLLSINLSLFGLPSFVIGALLLVLLAAKAGIFPLQGAATPYSELTGISKLMDILKHAALPIFTLILVYIPGHFLLTRSSVILILKEPYILTARGKGLNERMVKYKHGGRNALVPVVTAVGVQLASRIVTGALFVEIVFAYPGMGLLIFESMGRRDYPVIQGALLMVTLLVLTVNLLVDILYNLLDPRLADAH